MKKVIIFFVVISLAGCTVNKTPAVEKENVPLDDSIKMELEQVEAQKDNVIRIEQGDILDLSGKKLDKVPMSIFDQTSTKELDLSGNNITGAIPAEIRHLKNLLKLDLSDNQMTGVPAEIGQLSKLEILDLSNNNLTGLPLEIKNLKNLKKINLSDNNYSEYDWNLIRPSLSDSLNVISN